MSVVRLVSVSGGKDSTATLLLALETNWLDDVRAVFADTGNEHEITLEYVDFLSRATGIRIETVRADFTKQMAAKREKLLRIAAGVPESEIYGKRQFAHHWTPEKAARAAELMTPTGNPFFDLCIVRGCFPSRMRQFCTEELKGGPVDVHISGLLSEGHHIEQWHGVRADESLRRANLPDYEWGPIVSIRRPILRWGIERVFEQHRRHGIEPNPLYKQGFGRVGCMPCVNSGKREIAAMARRYTEHVEKVREYERIVAECARGDYTTATFFHTEKLLGERGIDAAIAWSRSKRGGDVRQRDAFHEAEPERCSSMYGLCE